MERLFPSHRRLLELAAVGAMTLGGAGCGDIPANSPSNLTPDTNSPTLIATPKPSESGTPPLPPGTTLKDPQFNLPFEGIGYLTAGPHNFKLPNPAPIPKNSVIAAELDIGPRAIINCKENPNAVVNDWNVDASASGKVVTVGDEKNPSDPNHSIVEIQHANGFSTRYTHLANIQVKIGQDVISGQLLGNPSCEFPPSGYTTGLHLDFSVFRNG